MLTLSVISPAYNSEDIIVGFLETISAQTWRDFEFIIVDDASTDRTADLIEKNLSRLSGRAQFIRHEKNLGQGPTIADAFSRATGDIVVKMDADSSVAPETFAKIMESFSADEGVGLVAVPLAAMDSSNWIVRGSEVSFVAQHRTDLKENTDEYAQSFGTCFAFRRHIFSVEDLSSRTDADLSWMAREQGWKVALRDDIAIQTRFPSTLPWTFERGRRLAWEVLSTYWHHKNRLLTRWAFWVKFAPLGLVVTALIRPDWAFVGLLGWFSVTQVFLALKAPDYPLADRLAAWVATVVRWSGFNVGVLEMLVRVVIDRFKSDK